MPLPKLRPVGSAVPVVEVALYLSAPLAATVSAPLLARALGVEARGQLAVVTSMFALCVALGGLGQPECLAAELRHGDASRQRARRHVAAVGGAIAAICGVLACRFLALPLTLGVTALATVPVASAANVWRAESIAVGRPRRVALDRAFATSIRVVALVTLAAVSALSLTAAALTLGGSVAISAAVLLLPRLGLAQDAAAAPPAARLVADGGSVLAFSVLTAVTLRLDVIVLQLLADARQLGFYAAAVSLSEAGLAVSGAFKTRMIHACYRSGGEPELWRLFRQLGVVAAVGAAVAVAAGPLLVTVVLGRQYAPAVPILRVLAVAALFQMLLDTGQGVLAVLGLRADMLLISGLGALLTLATLLLLVSRFGGTGAALASAVSYAVAGGAAWRKVRAHLRDAASEAHAALRVGQPVG